MSYYEIKANAEARRTYLQNEAQHERLANLLNVQRVAVRAIRFEIKVSGRLAHWRLQWKLRSETEVISYDPIPYSG